MSCYKTCQLDCKGVCHTTQSCALETTKVNVDLFEQGNTFRTTLAKDVTNGICRSLASLAQKSVVM